MPQQGQSELVKRWRAKYPGQYDDLTDSQLESKILGKYPQYKDLASTQAAAPPSTLPPQGAPLEGPSGPTSMRALTLADRVKGALRDVASGAKEALPAAGAATAVALTPATGGLSDLYLPVIAALLGGAGGTSAKQVASKALGEDSPKSMKEAVTQDFQGGTEQAGYEAGGKILSSVLSKWASGRAAAAGRSRIANLTAMTGVTGETGSNYSKVLSDLDATAAKLGVPKTPAGVYRVIDETGKQLDAEFNQALAPIGRKKVMPTEISQRIRSLITPNMMQTATGREEAKEIRRAALEYEKPWTYAQLNLQRMAENNKLGPFYSKESQGQSAALSAVQTKIAKAVRDESANIVYAAVDKANPNVGAQALKSKQGALWSLRDQLNSQIKSVADAQLADEGKTLRQKVSPSAIVSPSGARGYVRGLGKFIPGGGPEVQATKQAKKGMDLTRTNRALTLQRDILVNPLPNVIRLFDSLGKGYGKVSEQSDQGAPQ